MGCAGSKQVDVAAAEDVYLPPPASIAYFDLNTIGEPWLITTTTAANKDDDDQKGLDQKHTHVPLPILEKVDAYELPPQSWSEVSKALEDLKPSLQNPPTPKPQAPSPTATVETPKKSPATTPRPVAPKKTNSFHTLEELDAQVVKKNSTAAPTKPHPPAPASPSPRPPPSRATSLPPVLPEGLRPVSKNTFILRDREERVRRSSSTIEDPTRRWRRDPLDGLPEICPPGGADAVVLYTTTVRAVRRTFDDCETARQTVEGHLLGEVDVDERDVSLHGEYLKELRELVGGEGVGVPRLFVLGRYVGGVEEVMGMNEAGRLGMILRMVRRKAVAGGGGGAKVRGCEGCGGARFVPCFFCNGSCKVLGGGDGKTVVRCEECNENGLVQCPRCH